MDSRAELRNDTVADWGRRDSRQTPRLGDMGIDSGRAVALMTATAVIAALVAVPAVRAADLSSQMPPASSDDLWTRDKLTGDWGGARTALTQRGIDITLNYIGETFGMLAGGFRQGADYEHRIELSVDADLDKLAGWSGATAHATLYQIGHANGMPAQDYVGSIADPSNIEAQPSTRLFTAWFQKNFLDDKVSVRIGQIAADDEFLISQTSSNLIASTFGFATILAANQFQGGPVYPLATPGVRLQLKPNDQITFLSAVFAGAPAGANCTTLPQFCNPYGLLFPTDGGALFMDELQYGINQAKDAKGMPVVFKIGGWYATKSFPDEQFGLTASGAPVSLVSPLSVSPLLHHGNGGVYGVADGMVWRADKGPQSLNVFLRAGGSPSDRNLLESYVDAGFGLKAPLPGRDDDVLTFGVAVSKISSDAAALDQNTPSFTGTVIPVRDQEILFEFDYSLQLAPWWTLQADAQEILHPGGNVQNPLNPPQAIPNAFLLAARSTIKF